MPPIVFYTLRSHLKSISQNRLEIWTSWGFPVKKGGSPFLKNLEEISNSNYFCTFLKADAAFLTVVQV